ncbi:sensor histidine kinase [Eggerthellaceae bacterium zg-887]|uniref:HAMP domain-containing sensor histidine kinase n=1 Tax=Xiamenia xianingshaonis TaxID=2682776 RepID=UPI00140725FE|nr:HAMP domain-containing sensor histidine kinase [Xiamenia xianingshaonis]NHM15735.1 sensor histidine kinase [Xiamenia xianingshaonis]
MSGRAAGSEGKRIVRRLVGFSLTLTVIIAASGLAAGCIALNDASSQALHAQIVALNDTRVALQESSEAEGLAESGATRPDETGAPEAARESGAEGEPIGADNPAQAADATLAQAQDTLREAADVQNVAAVFAVSAVTLLAIAAVWGLVAYLYVTVVRPFLHLESFAADVAAGNLDAPLAYERSNPFGRFTWAFDAMRVDLKRARAAEAQAVEAAKTTVASLSHDIKTPIASIRAYSEALELGLDRTPEERAEYTALIMRKCDDVAALASDLFTHSLAELDRIAVKPAPAPIAETVRAAVTDFDASGKVSLTKLDEATVRHDPQRLTEALENLLANARKYAPDAPVEVSGARRPDRAVYVLHVRDFGPGMPAEDLPFAFDRFFRGSNAGDAPGAGLGLYIVRHLVERMGGTVHAENAGPGLRVVIVLPLENPLRHDPRI